MKNTHRHKIFLSLIATISASELAFSSPDVELAVDVPRRQFKVIINNVDKTPCLLLTHAGDPWFFGIELWHIGGRGYSLDPKHVYEAEEHGAFLTKWAELVIPPGKSHEFSIKWADLAGDEDVMAEVRKLLSQGIRFNNLVRARLVMSYQSEVNGKSKRVFSDDMVVFERPREATSEPKDTEQDGDEQPATAPKPKAEDDEKPDTETEGRSQ